MADSALPTASLMSCQWGLVEQKSVRSQDGPWMVHCVGPISPSIAATTAAIEIASGARASL